MKDQKASTLNRDLEDFSNAYSGDDPNALKQEIKNLQFIIAKYNAILLEYQKKYGNELFLEIDRILSNANDPQLPSNKLLNNNDNVSLKKYLVENIAVFKEYEKILLDKNQQIDFLNGEVNKLQTDNQKLILENDEIRTEIDKLKTDNAELYNTILDRQKMYGTNKALSPISKDDKNEELDNVNLDFDNTDLKSDSLNRLRKEKQKLLETVENMKYKTDYNANAYNDMKDKFDLILKDKAEQDEIINALQRDNEAYRTHLDKLQQRLKEQEVELDKLEKTNYVDKAKVNRLEIDNKTYKNQSNEFKELYDELEQRKSAEVLSLQNQMTEMKNAIETLKTKNKILEEKVGNIGFENSQLKQQNETLTFDRDHLTKILEDSNVAVQNASQKEKHLDSIIKSYQKKADDINLEKEKLNIKIRMQENQISKLTNDYSNLIKEKSSNFDTLVDVQKQKYEDIIKSKNDEINHLKAENLTNKIEKDKYYSDYNLIKGEFDKISSNFHAENDTYIAKYEQAQKQLNAMASNYEDKISDLTIRNDKLESENKQMRNEIQIYMTTERNRQTELTKLNQNELSLKSQLQKAQDQCNFYSKENENVINERDRSAALYETKIKGMKDNYEMKIITLENTINFQKNQLSLIQDKAYDMVKKQQTLTEKYKRECFNTIDYYEKIIATLTGKDVIKSGEDVE